MHLVKYLLRMFLLTATVLGAGANLMDRTEETNIVLEFVFYWLRQR